MYTYFKFDGTQTVNGAAPETIIQAFGWTKDKPLWFIEVDGEIRYNLVGSEDDVKAFIGESEAPRNRDKLTGSRPHGRLP